MGSSQTRARTRVPCIGRYILNHCATREAPDRSYFESIILLKKGEELLHGCPSPSSLPLPVQVLGPGPPRAWHLPGLEVPPGPRVGGRGSQSPASGTQHPAGLTWSCSARCSRTDYQGVLLLLQTPALASGVWSLSYFSGLSPRLGNLLDCLVFLDL